jgi:hypothetical protein
MTLQTKTPADKGWLLTDLLGRVVLSRRDSRSRHFANQSFVQSGYLAIALEAAGTNVLSHFPAVLIERRPLNIRLELSLGPLHREAYIVSKLRSLAANLAFRHNHT